MRIAWRLLTGILVAGLLIAGFALPAGAETELKQVPELTRVKAVAAAGEMYAALRADGKVFVWSVGAGGVEAVKPQQVEIGCPVRSVVPGANILAMACADGTVWTAGIAIDEPGVHRAVQVRGLDSVKSVALTRGALVALRTDGTVWVAEFGISEPGVQRAEQVPDLSGIIALAAGVGDFVAIKADGTAWSRMAINTKGTSAKRLANLPPVRSVAVCGPDDDCDGAADDYIFVTAGGEVIAWSVERDSQTATVPISGLDCAGCVSAGHRRLLAVVQDGSVRNALLAADGRIIVNDIKKGHTAFKQVATGTLWDMGLGADGTVFMWAAPNRPAQVPGLSEVAAVAAAGQWNLALKADGQLVCWGSNDAQRTYVIPHVFETRRVVA
ncbi:MAG TPA: hypothetical protein VNT75_23555, partial [Symbiobacteriaceae bacterium]|nr:hypothetical protein [Symbiobacteriaceae bacterium]